MTGPADLLFVDNSGWWSAALLASCTSLAVGVMMGDGLQIEPNTVQGVGEFLVDVGDHAAQAGLSFYGAWLPELDGPGISVGANSFAQSFGSLMSDFVLSTASLGQSVGTAAQIYLSVDDAAAYRLQGFG